MIYKPVICELKCISRDIQREIATAKEDTSFKEDIKETVEALKRMTMIEFLRLGCVLAIIIVFAIAITWVLNLSIIISLIVILLGMFFILYSFGLYIAKVHQRCVNYNRGNKI